MDILSLPIEIIQLIGLQPQDGQDRDRLRLNTLRLVCSYFNRAFEADVLSTLVILVSSTTLKQSMEMLWTFATQDKESSRAVQHARTLKIKYLSPVMALHRDLFRTSQPESESHEPENQDLYPSPPSLIRRLAFAISSVKRRFKKRTKLTIMRERHAIGEELMKEHLELAISSMKNLETVRWAVQIYDPSWTEAAVIRGLTRLPQLQDLQLIFNRHAPFELERSVGQIQFKLDRLSGLKKISLSGVHVHRPHDIITGLAGLIAKSPQLVHLEVKLGHHGISPETPTLHDVLSKVPEDHPLQLTHLALVRTGIRIDSSTLPHLRSLISLDLRNLLDLTDDADLSSERLERACSTSDICAILKQEGIYLKHVVVSDVGVFDYLCSYSGLETLDLCSFSFNTVEESNTAARTFFKFVLPQLVHSLQVLKIQPMHEGRWCFDPEDVIQSVVFSQCNKLRSLSVALKSSTSFIEFIDHPDLVQYKYNLDDVISSLINLSLSLPTLSEICIVIPNDVIIVNERGSTCHGKDVTGLITRSIIRFSLDVGHNIPHIGQVLPDIWVDGKMLYQYQTQPKVDVERQRYVLTYRKKTLDPYQ